MLLAHLAPRSSGFFHPLFAATRRGHYPKRLSFDRTVFSNLQSAARCSTFSLFSAATARSYRLLQSATCTPRLSTAAINSGDTSMSVRFAHPRKMPGSTGSKTCSQLLALKARSRLRAYWATNGEPKPASLCSFSHRTIRALYQTRAQLPHLMSNVRLLPNAQSPPLRRGGYKPLAPSCSAFARSSSSSLHFSASYRATSASGLSAASSPLKASTDLRSSPRVRRRTTTA